MNLREKRETLFTLVFSRIAHRSFGNRSLSKFKIDPRNTAGFNFFFLGGDQVRHDSEELLFL